MWIKIFEKHYKDFKVFADVTDNFTKALSVLSTWTVYKNIYFFCNLLSCLFVCLYAAHDIFFYDFFVSFLWIWILLKFYVFGIFY